MNKKTRVRSLRLAFVCSNFNSFSAKFLTIILVVLLEFRICVQSINSAEMFAISVQTHTFDRVSTCTFLRNRIAATSSCVLTSLPDYIRVDIIPTTRVSHNS